MPQWNSAWQPIVLTLQTTNMIPDETPTSTTGEFRFTTTTKLLESETISVCVASNRMKTFDSMPERPPDPLTSTPPTRMVGHWNNVFCLSMLYDLIFAVSWRSVFQFVCTEQIGVGDSSLEVILRQVVSTSGWQTRICHFSTWNYNVETSFRCLFLVSEYIYYNLRACSIFARMSRHFFTFSNCIRSASFFTSCIINPLSKD